MFRLASVSLVTGLVSLALAAPALAQPAPDQPAPEAPAPAAPEVEAPAPQPAPAKRAPAKAEPARTEDDDAALERQLAEAEERAGADDDGAQEASSLERSGFTVEASIGVGVLGLSPDNSELDSHLYSARTGVNVGVGLFVAPSVAVGVRIAAASSEVVTLDTAGGGIGPRLRLTTAFIGPSVQYWPTERVFVGAGAGFAMSMTDFADGTIDDGFGLDARIGYNVHLTRHHAFHVAAELFPTFFDEETIVGAGLSLGWQML